MDIMQSNLAVFSNMSTVIAHGVTANNQILNVKMTKLNIMLIFCILFIMSLKLNKQKFEIFNLIPPK